MADFVMPTLGAETSAGLGANVLAGEISARIMEGGFHDLDAPVVQVCHAEIPIPCTGHLEDSALPQAEVIARTVVELLGNAPRKP